MIGCEDRLRNDLYCVEWGVKLYSNQTKPNYSSTRKESFSGRGEHCQRNVTDLAGSTAVVGTEFLSPYPWESPYPRQSPGLPWGRNFYPHTHGNPHTHGRVQGCRGDGISIPIPTAESRAAVGTEFLSPYPPHTHTHGDPHTHGRPVIYPTSGQN